MKYSVRKQITVMALALIVAGAAWAGDDSGPAPKEGEVLAAAGFDLADYAGQVVLVDFWASWCKPCKESMPWLGEMQRKYGPEGLQVVAVNLDRKLDTAGAMLAAMEPGIIVVSDPEGELADRYELQGMPSSFVYDRGGDLAASHVGFLASECGKKEAELAELLKAAAPEVDDEK